MRPSLFKGLTFRQFDFSSSKNQVVAELASVSLATMAVLFGNNDIFFGSRMAFATTKEAFIENAQGLKERQINCVIIHGNVEILLLPLICIFAPQKDIS
jgi:hypothetical protein